MYADKNGDDNDEDDDDNDNHDDDDCTIFMIIELICFDSSLAIVIFNKFALSFFAMKLREYETVSDKSRVIAPTCIT